MIVAPATASPSHSTWAPVPDLLAGVTLEVRDLAAARRFYHTIVGDGSGAWTESAQGLALETDQQRIELVRRGRPRVGAEFGLHVALRVARSRLPATVDELATLGSPASWLREDHPAESELTAYVRDPDGNLVQLVPSESVDALIFDHVTLPCDDLEAADLFYSRALGGVVDHYYGWRTVDVHDARRSDEHAAPWTRLTKFSRVQQNTQTNPIPQLFLAFGATRLGLFVCTKHMQEPPEDRMKGTPSVRFRTATPADQVAAHLADVDVTIASTARRVRGVRFLRSEQRFFLRDPSGHFVVLECGA